MLSLPLACGALFFTQSCVGQVAPVEVPPMVPPGTTGCWVDNTIPCADHPDAPNTTSKCSGTNCIVVEVNGVRFWECPLPTEYYIGAGESIPRITAAGDGENGFTEYFDTEEECGIALTCECPTTEPPSFPIGFPPKCDFSPPIAGPAFETTGQLTQTWKPPCQGVQVGGEGEVEVGNK